MTKTVCLDCLVLVRMTVIAMTQDMKGMLLCDKVEKEENDSLDGEHMLAV